MNYELKCNISVFLNIIKVYDFHRKNADISRTQGVCHVIYMLYKSFSGKV